MTREPPDPKNLRKTSAEELYVESQVDALKKFRRIAKTSKVNPRTIPLTRKWN